MICLWIDSKMLKFFVVAVLLQLVSSQAIDYCDSTLCRAGVINIGCNNDRVGLTSLNILINYLIFIINVGLCNNLSLPSSNWHCPIANFIPWYIKQNQKYSSSWKSSCSSTSSTYANNCMEHWFSIYCYLKHKEM